MFQYSALRASQLVMAGQQACGVLHLRQFLYRSEADTFQINILAFMSAIMFARAMASDGDLLDLSPPEQEKALRFSIYFGIVNCLYVQPLFRLRLSY